MNTDMIRDVIKEKMGKVPTPVWLIVGAFLLFVIVDAIK